MRWQNTGKKNGFSVSSDGSIRGCGSRKKILKDFSRTRLQVPGDGLRFDCP
jgi:hypothetical protein